jgi:hypothetical protein
MQIDQFLGGNIPIQAFFGSQTNQTTIPQHVNNCILYLDLSSSISRSDRYYIGQQLGTMIIIITTTEPTDLQWQQKVRTSAPTLGQLVGPALTC